MAGKRRCPETGTLVANHPCLDDHAPVGQPGSGRQSCPPPACCPSRSGMTRPGEAVTALHRVVDDLADQRLGAPSASAAPVAPFAGPDAEIVFAHLREARSAAPQLGDGASMIEKIGQYRLCASRPFRETAQIILLFQLPAPTPTAALLSGHPPDLPPFTAHFPQNPAPNRAMSRQKDKRVITATCSPKRVRRGRQADGAKEVAKPPQLRRCP